MQMLNKILNTNELLNAYECKNGFYEVKPDYDANNPRYYSDYGSTFVMWHGKYNFDDRKDIGIDTNDYSSWEEIEKAIVKKYKPVVILSVYMYDHSGITINTTGFSCSWDSGQIGFIFITKEDAEDYYGTTDTTKLKQYLIEEIKVLNDYLVGSVYSIYFRPKDDLLNVEYMTTVYGEENIDNAIPKDCEKLSLEEYIGKFDLKIGLVLAN